MYRRWPTVLTLLLGAMAMGGANADPRTGREYRVPPEKVARAYALAAPPRAAVAPGGRFVLLAWPDVMPSIDELESGVTPTGGAPVRGLTLLDLGALEPVPLGSDLPTRTGPPRWAPGGERFLLTAGSGHATRVWIGDVRGDVHTLPAMDLARGHGDPCRWMPDGERLVCLLHDRPVRPRETVHPERPRPTVLDTGDPSAPDLSPASTGYYAQSAFGPQPAPHTRVTLADVTSGRLTPVGPAGRITRVSPAPDGRHLLVWTASDTFAARIQVWDEAGKVLLSRPAHDARLVQWSAGRPSALAWVEARAEGPRRGDRLVVQDAPFSSVPVEVFAWPSRITGMQWVAGGALLATTYDESPRQRRVWLVEPDRGPGGTRLLWTESVDSAYDDPGFPLTDVNAAGQRVVAEHGGYIFLAGEGAAPQGSRPFLDRLNLRTLERERLWRSREGHYERVDALLSTDAGRLLVRHESTTESPALQILDRASGARRAVTAARGPEDGPLLREQVIHYRRADGLPLSATLCLPADHAGGERLPLVIEAYPRNYGGAQGVGEVRGSMDRFPALQGLSARALVVGGYAVLRQVAMPVVGDPRSANDTFVEQIIANMKAAIDSAVEIGIADRDRVGVIGHSYGAFMVATALAHSDLFRAGVAASGAYNRTLTPFGFQGERRTLWEAPETYLRMSPFLYADRIKAPLLLLHGASDANPGTAPEQSIALYRAIRSNAGVARLVLLPSEGHVYRARESVLHAVVEMLDWFDHHLREAPAKEGKPIHVAAAQASR